jgi:hypothetical protein
MRAGGYVIIDQPQDLAAYRQDFDWYCLLRRCSRGTGTASKRPIYHFVNLTAPK